MTVAHESLSTAFRALHAPGSFLVLPNAWDAASARVVEECGAPAIATSSAALAWARGYPDGNAMPPRVAAAGAAEIARVVRVPLSVDAEAGYSDDPATAAEYLKRLEPPERALEATLARAARYRAAGCDGVFVPLIKDAADIRAIVAAIAPLPLNALAIPGLGAATELRALGVRRLSAGAALATAALARIRRLAGDFLRDGRSDPLFDERIDSAAMNASFRRE